MRKCTAARVPERRAPAQYRASLRHGSGPQTSDARRVPGRYHRTDPAVVSISGVTGGDLFGGNGLGFYGHQKSEGRIRIDGAMLGTGLAVQHSGTLAAVHFRMLQCGDPALALGEVMVRGASNGAQQVQVRNTAAELPASFGLSQNYPNPFNPTTVIKYQLPSPVSVEVVVYNLLGEKVATLVDEVQAAGYYTIQWNGRNSRNIAVPTGMYIYTMKAGDFSSVKKMMLVK